MAKASIKVRMPDDVFVGVFDILATELGKHSKTEAHFSIADPSQLPPELGITDVHIIMQGHGFGYKDGELVRGIITKVTYEDEDGRDYAVYTKLNANIAKVDPDVPSFAPVQELFLKGNDTVGGSREADILYGGAGDDVIKGLNGDDEIIGGRGNDTLTGSLGNDRFDFQKSLGSIGNDVITDFEVSTVFAGGVVHHDRLVVDELPDLTKLQQVGNNTVIDMGDGFSITLLNVQKDTVSAEDFDIAM